VQTPEVAVGLLKFAHQPAGGWRERRAYLADDSVGIATVQDIEEKMSNGKVERALGQAAGHCVNLVKLHARLFAGWHPQSRQIDHPCADFDYRDARVPIRVQQSREKSPIAFAEN
jgi:hypothetical protein